MKKWFCWDLAKKIVSIEKSMWRYVGNRICTFIWLFEQMTDARSKFELRRLKVPELKHFLKGKRIPYTEKRTEEFVLLDERTES